MRRCIGAALAFVFLLSSAFAENYAFCFSDGAAVVDENGTQFIATNIYERICALHAQDGAIVGYAAGATTDSAMRYALVSPAGERLTDFLYTSIAVAGESFICGTGNAYLILSSSGIAGNDEYSAIAYAGDGAFLTLSGNINDEIADPLMLLAADGTQWQPDISLLYGLGTFSESLMPACDGGRVLFGYIGTDGTWQIAPEYEYAGDFSGGYAIVSTDAGYGILDATGTVSIAANCDFIERSNDHFLVQKDGAFALYEVGANSLSKAFEQNADAASPRLSGNNVIVYADDQVCVLDKAGKARFTLPSTATVNEVGGLFVVRNGDWAARSAYLADADGKQLSEKHNTIRLLEGTGSRALFAYGVMANDSYDMKFGLLRGDGTIVTDPLYDELASVGPGLFCAVATDGVTLINGVGNVISVLG